MSATPRPRRDVRWTAVGFICGGLTGLTVLTSGVVAAAVDSVPLTRATAVERGVRDVLHTPPLLVARGQRVNVRYDVVCQSNGLGEPCELSGNIFVRRNGEFGYRRIPLVASEGSALTAALDGVAAGEGFSYYAIVEDASGSTITVPAGGAAAPQRAWVVPAMTVAPLGTHAFGHPRRPDSRSMTASWGSGTNAFGLITGRGQVAIGPSAFDVAPDGSITVLDQVNDRLAVYSQGRVRYEPIVFAGAEGDLAIGADERRTSSTLGPRRRSGHTRRQALPPASRGSQVAAPTCFVRVRAELSSTCIQAICGCRPEGPGVCSSRQRRFWLRGPAGPSPVARRSSFGRPRRRRSSPSRAVTVSCTRGA